MAENAIVATILKFCTSKVQSSIVTRQRPTIAGANFLFQGNLVVVVKCDGTDTTVRCVSNVEEVT